MVKTEPHDWLPKWGLWPRIKTALLAMEDVMDDKTDPLLRMEVADLNQVVPNLRDPSILPPRTGG